MSNSKFLSAAFITITAFFVFSLTKVHAAPLQPVNISYSIGLDSSKFGTATLGKIDTSLSKTENGFAIESVTRFQGMAAIMTGNNHQESCEFAVKENQAVTNKYSGGKIGKNEYNVDFDWESRKINFSNEQTIDMPEGYIVDNCVLWFAAALLKGEDLGNQAMYVVDGKKNRIRGYKQRSSSAESIETKLGNKEVIKLVLERELHEDRTVTFWLSPDNQFLPMRIQESRKSRTITFDIESLELLDS